MNTAHRPGDQQPGLADERRSRAEGFTLIEVLIVVVIIGVLSATVVFAVREIRDRGENASCISDRRIVGDAAVLYMKSNELTSIPGTGAADADQYERTLVQARMLKQVSRYHTVAADGTVTSSGAPCP